VFREKIFQIFSLEDCRPLELCFRLNRCGIFYKMGIVER